MEVLQASTKQSKIAKATYLQTYKTDLWNW